MSVQTRYHICKQLPRGLIRLRRLNVAVHLMPAATDIARVLCAQVGLESLRHRECGASIEGGFVVAEKIHVEKNCAHRSERIAISWASGDCTVLAKEAGNAFLFLRVREGGSFLS